MEGVGARLGRSSNRYGPSNTVFTGPVRSWEKKWVHVPPPTSSHTHSHRAAASANGSDAASYLLLYKWTPIVPRQTKDSSPNGSNNGNGDYSKDEVAGADEPPKKKFKYIPIVVLEEQKDEPLEHMEDETKPFGSNPNAVETISNDEGYDDKPDINEATTNNPEGRQDLNESTLDLSLGMGGGRDGENEFESKPNPTKSNQLK